MGANLLELSVDELFESHSITEIDQIQKKLLAEVEKKREELRTMVGERYRDLLKAADTIGKMKETSSSVVTQIAEITAHCKNLNEKQLIGFKTDSHQLQLENKQMNLYFSTVFQIKLLTSLPEMIWSHIDNNRYFVATQLFIFSRHISTGLQLDVDNNFIKHFPVAKKQWEILKPFYITLKQVSTVALERQTISIELAFDCLLALFLLEKSSLEEILNIFLHLRTKAYLATLCSNGEKGAKRRVRERILDSLKVLISTVELIESCFMSKGASINEISHKGLILQELEKLSDTSAQPTISLMHLDDTDLICVLPDIISKFRPSFEISTLSVEMIKQKVENWYLSISNVTNNQLKNLFDLISSMKTLQEIQKESIEIEKTSSCSNKFNAMLLPSIALAFYQNLYKPLLTARVREIIRQCWLNCINTTCDEINQFLKSNLESGIIDEEVSLWVNQLEDLPVSLKVALNQDNKQYKLLMKSKGYNQNIIKICSSFDDRLGIVLDDLNFFLNGYEEKYEEKHALEDYMREISKENAYKLIEIIKSQSDEQAIMNYILLARILSALVELCSKFKFCVIYTHTDGNWEKLSLNDKNTSGMWYQVCKLFEEESFKYWKNFCDRFLEQNPIEKWKTDNLDYKLILQDFLNWDSISIDEHDEQGNPLQSTIKVPLQITISLQSYFFELITSLNQYVPQTLPRKVLHYFSNILLQCLLGHYTKLLDKKFSSLCQNIALQIYFDLKFLQLLFITREDKQEQEIVQKLTNILKTYIDPFDFELFHTHLNNNVKKCAIRMQHQLGTILSHTKIPGVASSDVKQFVAVQDRDPNVLCISCNGSSSTWFPLLPIVVPGQSNIIHVGETETEKPFSHVKQQKKVETTKSSQISSQPALTAQTYASNVKSGAAAFFGAMSQDWFR